MSATARNRSEWTREKQARRIIREREFGAAIAATNAFRFAPVYGVIQTDDLTLSTLPAARDAAPPGQIGKGFGFVSAGLLLGSAVTPVPFGILIDKAIPNWCWSWSRSSCCSACCARARPEFRRGRGMPWCCRRSSGRAWLRGL